MGPPVFSVSRAGGGELPEKPGARFGGHKKVPQAAGARSKQAGSMGDPVVYDSAFGCGRHH